jgi:hypothetical protein
MNKESNGSQFRQPYVSPMDVQPVRTTIAVGVSPQTLIALEEGHNEVDAVTQGRPHGKSVWRRHVR